MSVAEVTDVPVAIRRPMLRDDARLGR